MTRLSRSRERSGWFSGTCTAEQTAQTLSNAARTHVCHAAPSATPHVPRVLAAHEREPLRGARRARLRASVGPGRVLRVDKCLRAGPHQLVGPGETAIPETH